MVRPASPYSHAVTDGIDKIYGIYGIYAIGSHRQPPQPLQHLSPFLYKVIKSIRASARNGPYLVSHHPITVAPTYTSIVQTPYILPHLLSCPSAYSHPGSVASVLSVGLLCILRHGGN